MPHDRQLEKAVVAELLCPGSALGARVVVTAVAVDVVLIDRAASFAEGDGDSPLPASIPSVGEATDDLDVRAARGRYSRLLPAARRALSDAHAHQDESSTGSTGSATLANAMLTVTGEIDWRQRACSADGDHVASPGYQATSNISEDILQMLPCCFLSISRASR